MKTSAWKNRLEVSALGYLFLTTREGFGVDLSNWSRKSADFEYTGGY
jgi:hypothetical protein